MDTVSKLIVAFTVLLVIALVVFFAVKGGEKKNDKDQPKPNSNELVDNCGQKYSAITQAILKNRPQSVKDAYQKLCLVDINAFSVAVANAISPDSSTLITGIADFFTNNVDDAINSTAAIYHFLLNPEQSRAGPEQTDSLKKFAEILTKINDDKSREFGNKLLVVLNYVVCCRTNTNSKTIFYVGDNQLYVPRDTKELLDAKGGLEVISQKWALIVNIFKTFAGYLMDGALRCCGNQEKRVITSDGKETQKIDYTNCYQLNLYDDGKYKDCSSNDKWSKESYRYRY